MTNNLNIPPKISVEGKPKYINIGDEHNFFELFRKIERNFVNCFLFESLGEESNISRYHILGFDPKYILYSENNNQLVLENTKNRDIYKYDCENPYLKLRDVVPQNIISKKGKIWE